MIPGATRSRAAILCFGGWGLQTMLHLASRLRESQEQRMAAAIDGPDLTHIARFATLMAEEQVGPDGQMALQLLTLQDTRLPPFYLEGLLQRLRGASSATSLPSKSGHWPVASGFGQAQRWADLLREAAAEVLVPLTWQESETPRDPEWSGANTEYKPQPTAMTRRVAFRAALRAGDEIARAFSSNIINPIRADIHAPTDPFVQTTLYVVAPLYEPLTSALIWPLVAHQLQDVGQRHISQVVGIFATGSYATDNSRRIEDASCYAAIAELEALTGLRRANLNEFLPLLGEDPVVGNDPWTTSDTPGPRSQITGPWGSWLGRRLFDRIYLLDREKSNQGLAHSSYELSVLVGNSLQALIAADGAAFVDEQIGIDLRNARERPYSLLGAATDYVPLTYILQTLQEQEEKRLLREQILTPVESEEGGSNSPLGLAELGATPPQVLGQLISQLPDLFEDRAPQSLDQLAIHPEYILPADMALKLRGLDPISWQSAFDEQFQTVLARLEESIGPTVLDNAWGLDALGEDGLPLNPRDQRFLPATSRQMRDYLLTLLSAQPCGILRAQQQLQQWLTELKDLSVSPPREEMKRQPQVREWRIRYLGAIADQPSLPGSLVRALCLLGGIALLAWLHVVMFRQPFDLEVNGTTFLGLMAGALSGAILAYRLRLRRAQTLRQERVELASLELTAHVQERVHHGLVRAYGHLEQMVRHMAHALEDTCEELREWSVDTGMPALPPHTAGSHLYRPHFTAKLWARCQAILRNRQDLEGRQGEERLWEIWTSLRRRRQLASLLSEENAASYARRSPAEFIETGSASPLAETLFNYIRESVKLAVTGLQDSDANQVRTDLVRTLAHEYNLEHLLWRDASSPTRHVHGPHGNAASRTAPEQSRGGAAAPDAQAPPRPFDVDMTGPSHAATMLRYLENVWTAAKPAANHDVSDRLASHGLPVEFAAVSGNHNSDLTEDVLQGLRVTRLLSGDPFQITFVRTMHGFELKDVASIYRYRTELVRLPPSLRPQLLLMEPAPTEPTQQ